MHDSADFFDPYHRWLGIPPAEQPPHHYRLLGIAIFEEDEDVIRDAAQRQALFVKTHRLSEHHEECQDVLGQISRAKTCLLSTDEKLQYDTELRRQLGLPIQSEHGDADTELLQNSSKPPIPLEMIGPQAGQLRTRGDFEAYLAAERSVRRQHLQRWLHFGLLLVGLIILGWWNINKTGDVASNVKAVGVPQMSLNDLSDYQKAIDASGRNLDWLAHVASCVTKEEELAKNPSYFSLVERIESSLDRLVEWNLEQNLRYRLNHCAPDELSCVEQLLGDLSELETQLGKCAEFVSAETEGRAAELKRELQFKRHQAEMLSEATSLIGDPAAFCEALERYAQAYPEADRSSDFEWVAAQDELRNETGLSQLLDDCRRLVLAELNEPARSVLQKQLGLYMQRRTMRIPQDATLRALHQFCGSPEREYDRQLQLDLSKLPSIKWCGYVLRTDRGELLHRTTFERPPVEHDAVLAVWHAESWRRVKTYDLGQIPTDRREHGLLPLADDAQLREGQPLYLFMSAYAANLARS